MVLSGFPCIESTAEVCFRLMNGTSHEALLQFIMKFCGLRDVKDSKKNNILYHYF